MLPYHLHAVETQVAHEHKTEQRALDSTAARQI